MSIVKQAASTAGLIRVSDDLKYLLALVHRDAEGAGIRPHMLTALRQELEVLDPSRPVRVAAFDARTPWIPRPDQIWNSNMKRKDGRRLSAYAFYQIHFQDLQRDQLPFAHEVRQNPATKDFYDSLCVYCSRNRARGVEPSTIAHLFPVLEEAKGGRLKGPR